jgi:two-component system response regulator DegU
MILIVDDNLMMRKTIRAMLADIDTDVRECADGMEAVRTFHALRPDWVLMDVRMNGLDGIDATRTICAAHPDARVIILTNYDDDALRNESRSAGARDYVLKDDLTVLRALLGR